MGVLRDRYARQPVSVSLTPISPDPLIHSEALQSRLLQGHICDVLSDFQAAMSRRMPQGHACQLLVPRLSLRMARSARATAVMIALLYVSLQATAAAHVGILTSKAKESSDYSLGMAQLMAIGHDGGGDRRMEKSVPLPRLVDTKRHDTLKASPHEFHTVARITRKSHDRAVADALVPSAMPAPEDNDIAYIDGNGDMKSSFNTKNKTNISKHNRSNTDISNDTNNLNQSISDINNDNQHIDSSIKSNSNGPTRRGNAHSHSRLNKSQNRLDNENLDGALTSSLNGDNYTKSIYSHTINRNENNHTETKDYKSKQMSLANHAILSSMPNQRQAVRRINAQTKHKDSLYKPSGEIDHISKLILMYKTLLRDDNLRSRDKMAPKMKGRTTWISFARCFQNKCRPKNELPIHRPRVMGGFASASDKIATGVGDAPIFDSDRGNIQAFITDVLKPSISMPEFNSNTVKSTVDSNVFKEGVEPGMKKSTTMHKGKSHFNRRRKYLLSRLRRMQRSAVRQSKTGPTDYSTDTRSEDRESVLEVEVQNLVTEGTGRGVNKIAAADSEESADSDGESEGETITSILNKLPAGATAREGYLANQQESLANITRMMASRRNCSVSGKSDAVRLIMSADQVNPHFKVEVTKVVEVANHINNLLLLSRGRQLSRENLLNQFFALAETVLETGQKVLGCSIFYTFSDISDNNGSNTDSIVTSATKTNNNSNSGSRSKRKVVAGEDSAKNAESESRSKKGSSSLEHAVSTNPYLYPFAYRNESTQHNDDNGGNNNNNNSSSSNNGPSPTIVLTDLSKEWDPRRMPFVTDHLKKKSTSHLLLPTRVFLTDQDAFGDLDPKTSWSHMIKVGLSDGVWGRPYYECLFRRMVIQFSVPFYRLGGDGTPEFQ